MAAGGFFALIILLSFRTSEGHPLMNAIHFSSLQKPGGLFSNFKSQAASGADDVAAPTGVDDVDSFENTQQPPQEDPPAAPKQGFFSKLKSWGKKILTALATITAIRFIWNKLFKKAAPSTPDPAPTAG